MPGAARLLDPTNHPGAITGPGVPTVLINGRPAVCQGDQHACSMPPTAGPHPPNPIAKGSLTVLIGNRPAARMGDPTGCGATIVGGSIDVFIGG
jgi:uncharacterized Zn-binding protein involved in type VI secretion